MIPAQMTPAQFQEHLQAIRLGRAHRTNWWRVFTHKLDRGYTPKKCELKEWKLEKWDPERRLHDRHLTIWRSDVGGDARVCSLYRYLDAHRRVKYDKTDFWVIPRGFKGSS